MNIFLLILYVTQLHLKQEGNEIFKAGNYKKAITLYSRAIAYTHGMPGSSRALGEADIARTFGGQKVEPLT